MKPKIHVNLAFKFTRPEDFEFLGIQDLHPEFYFSGEEIDILTPETLADLGKRAREKNFTPLLHGPFFDLNFGAHDPRVRKVVEDRAVWALETAKGFGCPHVVLHHGHGTRALPPAFRGWLERARETLKRVAAAAEARGLRIAMENTFDSTPEDLLAIREVLGGKSVGFCFDVGHFNLFSQVSMGKWLDSLGPDLLEIHLHDNLGTEDDHIAVGDGTIKFGPLINWLRTREQLPSLTLEMEQKTHVIKSVARIREWFEPESD